MPEKTELKVVSLKERLASFDEHWVPKVVGQLNGQYVKVVKFSGEYVWHKHENEDELFLVLDGAMKLELEGRTVDLKVGEFVIVPRNVMHRPVAESFCHALLFEPVTTRNTGNVDHDYTIEANDLEKI